MRMNNLEEYKKQHTIRDIGFCLEVDSLKAAIILSIPYRITWYKDQMFQSGKPIIKWVK